ncbi:MAG: DinB family protein [Silicimonas sp.]|nr:DinB family protein [Silicimonas sp.]
MIRPDFVKTMARYNRWQNSSLYRAAAGLEDAERRLDRGAFFGSIHGTLSHLLWGDSMWMSRFDGWDKPGGGVSDTPNWVPDWDDLVARRAAADERIMVWADAVTGPALDGELSWYSGILERDIQKPLALCVVHFFNHQTHHRGQVHAMLTAAGARPDDTDLFIMPGEG